MLISTHWIKTHPDLDPLDQPLINPSTTQNNPKQKPIKSKSKNNPRRQTTR